MADTNPTNRIPGELPSSRRLLRSTAIAAVVAVLLLVTTVLPAEYGIDPTGIGRVLGLKQMGDIKVSLAREAAADAAADAAAAAAEEAADSLAAAGAILPASGAGATATADTTAARTHDTRVTMQPGEGKEVKLVMQRGNRATYSWSTDRGVVNFLTHGDTTNAPPNTYHTYGKGSAVRSDEGMIEAVFDGFHGWFWRNRTQEIITVTLRTSGDYKEIKAPPQ